jgi:hypothetical protein
MIQKSTYPFSIGKRENGECGNFGGMILEEFNKLGEIYNSLEQSPVHLQWKQWIVIVFTILVRMEVEENGV